MLDQFEQWLHARRDEQEPQLIQALRHCDGGHVQCIVMVRDDFWLAVSRFMRDLEISVVEGHNSALVDLFDLDHARRVLVLFGRAFGRLPQSAAEMTGDQRKFLDQAVHGLASDGKVISIRLALFAEMMKDKPWSPASLRKVGGTEGVGVAFLEETFSSSTASPEYRFHQKAARAVLKTLLPEAGTDIKGHMRSREELLETSGYRRRPAEFDRVVHLLDQELRLITPTDPEGAAAGGPSETPSGPRGQYYQLTHDYLVPALREWLTRKQKETWRGRAELRLAERTSQWTRAPESRFLPSLPEYLSIVCGVPRKQRTPPQRAMLRAATKHHLLRWGSLLTAFLLTAVFVQQFIARAREDNDRQRAESLVEVVLTAPADAVPLPSRT